MNLRGMARATRKRRGAAFERRDALLQHRLRRVADAGVDVAERLQPEQRGGVIDVVEHEGRGLVDRRRARAGRRIGLGAGMDGEGGEAGRTFGHRIYPLVRAASRPVNGALVYPRIGQGQAGAGHLRRLDQSNRCICKFGENTIRNKRRSIFGVAFGPYRRFRGAAGRGLALQRHLLDSLSKKRRALGRKRS